MVILLLSTRLLSFSMTSEEIDKDFVKTGFTPQHHQYLYQDDYIHYVTCGDSSLTPLLLVHGSPGSWDNFVKLITSTSLLDEFYLIAVDRPGYGQSGHKEFRDLESQSRALAELIKRYFRDDRGYVMGHSYGGALCLQLAADYGPRIQAVILAAGTVADTFQEPRWYNYAVKYTPVGWLVDGSFDRSNKEMWALPEDLRKLYPRLRNTEVGIVLIQGNQDFLVDPQSPIYLRGRLPDAKITLITKEKMDHFLIWNDMEMVMQGLEKAVTLYGQPQAARP